MPSLSHAHYALAALLALLALATPRPGSAYSYSMRMPSGTDAAGTGTGTGTPPRLISKLLVQSPALDNIYMDYLVTSKPLNLRKYNKNGSKTKKTKKDSKIYFIPIPPLPYRYIPGVGYDYQPMKIKPILQETPSSTTSSPKLTTDKNREREPAHSSIPTTVTPTTTTQSKLLRVQHHKDYYFNGRPFRLQVARADRKSALTPLNLKSKFYYNKNIIY
ncbi:uncharacterized protein [Drosophila virilis]|uniref:DUF4794 domain-containing protein n=1 Tax=Drosophila virilis TaxID=7244 RepID=B4LXT8_DROVI|nr:uncharacterized protein LOC6630074 [Drosophila virilis]XP_032295265.1 uncharacterized protein LOC6630074 [Drosophila virilis]EDW67897.1 uncharacterized protein Dvir_GJ24415 [Drosophila virilis]